MYESINLAYKQEVKLMNILIIDDERNVCDIIEVFLRSWLERREPERDMNIMSFYGIPGLLSYFDDGNKADIVFMDIKLKKYNGINLACKIQEINKKAIVIFMTGYIEYAEEIFKAKPFHFLIKPITAERVDEVMDRAVEFQKEISKRMLCFKIENVAYCVDKNDIYYIEAAGKNVNIYTKEKSYRVNASFKTMESQTEDILLKCHRSYIINPEKVRKFSRTQVYLISGEIIPISRSNSREICEKICNRVTSC